MEFKGTGKEWDSVEINISDLKQLTIICKEPKQVIAHIYLPDWEITEELNANKQLIVCAPEILESLKNILLHYDDVMSSDFSSFALRSEIDKAKEIIKKATTI